MSLAPGTKLGRYEIRSKLGEGGMGEVYLAVDLELDRRVAIKILPEVLASDQQRLQRFIHEAKAACALNHPHILTVHEIGGAAGGSRFIATEFIDGETLRERMESGLTLYDAVEFSIQLAGALAAAHAAGIVHRDVKPENVMVRRDGYVKVLDFGLAKLTEPTGSASDPEAPTKAMVNTVVGMVMGTPNYMSPEQAKGIPVDARSDIWSLGAVLYEMIAGRVPFKGETLTETISLILQKDAAPLTRFAPNTPAELERIVNKALTKDREDRYQVMKDLLIDLRALKRKLDVEAEIERMNSPEVRATLSRSRHVSIAASSTVTQTAVSPAPSSAERVVTEIKRHKLAAVLVLAAVVLAIAGFGYFYFVRNAEAEINSVAVMPFVNESGDPNTEYLSEGISESLINNLSQLPQLKVIARTSTFRYKDKEIDPKEVAKTLGVGAIVTGRVIQRGDDLQVSVELIRAHDKTQMWGEHYNRRATDLQAVQAEIARAISEKLRLRLTGAQQQQLTKQATGNPQAYQTYLTGLFYQREGNIDGAKKALDYYNQAIALDPNFALAYASMPANYVNLARLSVLDSREALAKAEGAAQKALELDETLAEAHNGMAAVKQFEWDWPRAESESKRAIELNPNLAAAHANYSIYLTNMGRITEALTELKRAEELDPLRLGIKLGEPGILLRARRYDEAIQGFQNLIKLQPDFSEAHFFLGQTYEMKGMYAEAIDEYQKTISIDGETPSYLCYLGHALAVSGKREEAFLILNKLKTTKATVSPAELAILYVGLGDKEMGLQSLERAYSEHDPQMQYLKVVSLYDPLRADPRFQTLMRQVGLPY